MNECKKFAAYRDPQDIGYYNQFKAMVQYEVILSYEIHQHHRCKSQQWLKKRTEEIKAKTNRVKRLVILCPWAVDAWSRGRDVPPYITSIKRTPLLPQCSVAESPHTGWKGWRRSRRRRRSRSLPSPGSLCLILKSGPGDQY